MKSNYSVGGVDLYDRYPTTDTPNVIRLMPTFTDMGGGQFQRYLYMAADSDWLVVAWTNKVVVYRDYGKTQVASTTRITPDGKIATPMEVVIFKRPVVNTNHVYSQCFAIRWAHGDITINRLIDGVDVRVVTAATANLRSTYEPYRLACNRDSLFVYFSNVSDQKIVQFRNPFNAPTNADLGFHPFAVATEDLSNPYTQGMAASDSSFVVLNEVGRSIYRISINSQTRLFGVIKQSFRLPELVARIAFRLRDENPGQIQFVAIRTDAKKLWFGNLNLFASNGLEIYDREIDAQIVLGMGAIYDPDDFYANKNPSDTVNGDHRINIDDRLPFVFVDSSSNCLYGSFIPGPELPPLDIRVRRRGEFHWDHFKLPNPEGDNTASSMSLTTSGRTIYWATNGYINRTQFDIPITHPGYQINGKTINALSGFDMSGNTRASDSGYRIEGLDLARETNLTTVDKHRPGVRTIRALGDHVRETISHMFESRPGGIRVHKNLMFVHGNDGKLHRSTNYGKMFVARNPHFLTNSVQGICVEDNVVIAGGSGARIAFSTDYGETFTVGQTLPSQFNHITCMDMKGGIWFAASHNGRIFRGIGPSLALGQEVPSANGSRRFIDIKIIGNTVDEPYPLCIAVGVEARIKFSRDYGFTWDTVRHNVPADAPLNTIVALGDVIMVLGENGWAVRSADRGKTWTTMRIPGERTNVSAFEMHGIFYAVGSRYGTSGVRRSFDLGLTWENLPIQGNGFFRGIHGSGDRIAAVSDENYLGIFEVRSGS